MGTEQIEGVGHMATKPAIRITAGDVPAPEVTVNVSLFGGHLDGLVVSQVEIPGAWPVITTLEPYRPKGAPADEHVYIPRAYTVCLCNERVSLDRRRRVRYCIEG